MHIFLCIYYQIYNISEMDKVEKCVCADDYRKLAKKKLSLAAFHYIDGGSDEEVTKKRNQQIFRRFVMIPRVLVSTSNTSMSTSILGHQFALPFGFAPWAMNTLCHPQGELIPAKVAAQNNICNIISILTNKHPKQIHQVAPNSFRLLQLYISDDWEVNKKAIKIAEQNGFSGVVITVDAQVLGIRRKEKLYPLNHDNYSYPILEELASQNKDKPTERLGFLRKRDLSLDWEKIKKFRSMTSLKLVLKGIIHPEDTLIARDLCDAIYVSNHGGRQLDTTLTAPEILPQIRSAVGQKFPILADGGIRTGMDIFKMLALGANYVFFARPVAYALTQGESGVQNLVTIYKDELLRTMILNGTNKISEINSSYLGIRPNL